MAIESIIETQPWDIGLNETGTITTVIASTAVVGVATLFTTELVVGDIISLIDTAGVRQVYRVATITDNLNLVLDSAAVSAAAGVTYSISVNTPTYFVGNNAINKAFIIRGTDTPMASINVSLEKRLINANDGLLVKSVYIRMPYQYTMSDTPITVQFLYLDNSGAIIDLIRTIGEDGFFTIPIENIEIPVNAYVPTPITSGTTRWQISANIINADVFSSPASNGFRSATVSQVDSPSQFNNVLLPVIIGIRIEHVNPLQSITPP